MGEQRLTAEEAVHDLTLALLYLTRFKEGRGKQEDQLFRAWKSYDWDTVDKLNSERFVIDKHGNKSLLLTENGVKRAREILDELGIMDWRVTQKVTDKHKHFVHYDQKHGEQLLSSTSTGGTIHPGSTPEVLKNYSLPMRINTMEEIINENYRTEHTLLQETVWI